MITLNRHAQLVIESLIWALIIFLTTSRSWLLINFDLNLDYLIYTNFFILFLIKLKSLIEYAKYLIHKNIKALDTYIYGSLVLFIILNSSIENISSDLLSFLVIYLLIRASLLFPMKQESSQNILYGLLVCSLVTILGIYSGVIEYLFLKTAYLHEIKDTPSPIKIFPGFFGGLQESYNQSAYIIMGSLGLLGFLNFSNKLKYVYGLMCWIALFLTGAKVVFLFLVMTIIIRLFSSKSIFLTKTLLGFSFLGYIFFSHIVFIKSGEMILSEKYFREIAFQFHGTDFYLSLFSWLKIESFNYFMIKSEIGASLNEFKNFTKGYDPHFFLASLVFMGGIIFAASVYIRVIKSTYFNFKYGLKDNIYFSALAIVFFCEIIIWDSQNSLIFWIVTLYAVSNKEINYKLQNSI